MRSSPDKGERIDSLSVALAGLFLMPPPTPGLRPELFSFGPAGAKPSVSRQILAKAPHIVQIKTSSRRIISMQCSGPPGFCGTLHGNCIFPIPHLVILSPGRGIESPGAV